MKTIFLIISAVFFLFCSGSCEDDRIFIVQNNSDMDIIIMNARYKDVIEPWCIYTGDEDFNAEREVKANSTKNVKLIYTSINYSPLDTTYLIFFNRMDIDTMTCEEFKEKWPVKKVWALTKKDAEALDWTLVYP
jgi:hypothetical protein